MDLVKELREKTQVGMMDCKKALEETNGDIEKAIELLRKKGAAVAAKRADNAVTKGRIESYISPDFKIGAMVEVGCETDFSANTDNMKNFVVDAAKAAVQSNPADVAKLLAAKSETNPKIAISDVLNDLISKICEKIQINRFVQFQVAKNGIVNTYIHPGSTVGVLVELETEKDATPQLEELKQVAKDVCMQIAVNKPLYVDPTQIDAETIAKERSIAKEQLKDTKKPEAIIEKIVDGKMNKFYEDVCLLHQLYIKNDKISIKQHLAEVSNKLGNQIKVKQFKRFGIGK
jgi:elongation factor Ts